MTEYRNADGVIYDITTNGATDTVKVKVPGQATQTFTSVPKSHVITASGHVDLSTLQSGDYFIVPGATTTLTIGADVGTKTTIHVGGTATINVGLSLLSDVTIDVDGGTVTAGTLAAGLGGMTINLDNGGMFSTGSGIVSILDNSAINFGPGGGTLVANAGTTLFDLSKTTINGFDTSVDKIEFQGLTAPIKDYKISSWGDSQTVTLFGKGGHELGSFTVEGTHFADGTVHDGQSGPLSFTELNGNLIIDPGTSILCFYEGTMVQTPDGEQAVETLKMGDLVLTADGKATPVRWLGVNTVSTLFADPIQMLPIRIQAGALGDNVPSRDLLVSPDHAIFFDGILVQAGALKNGVSILQDANVPQTFKYYHVEVEGHEIIVAEGTPVETFVDNVNRMNFDNWAEHVQLYGTDTSVPEMSYPRAKSARQVPYALRRKLDNRMADFIVTEVAA